MTESQPTNVRGTQDGALLNTRQWRLANLAVQQGYAWWLQEGSSAHFVIAHDVEHPYSERSLLIYNAGRATTVFLAAPGTPIKRITQREAFTLLTHQTL